MKDKWIRKYKESVKSVEFNSKILTGFNANIDSTTKFENLDIDLKSTDAEKLESLKNQKDLQKALKYCKENSSNLEVSISNFEPEIDGENQLGGQGGIMANFLSGLGNQSILYTPFLSNEIADLMEPGVVYPVVKENLGLSDVSNAVNSDRSKKNYIIEFEDESCRLILSDDLRGFGPYFRKGLSEKLHKIEDSIDRILLSGFHDADGNVEAKLKKSKQQLVNINVPKHLEFVSKSREQDELILEHVAPHFTSLGLDGQELSNVAEILGIDISSDPSLGEAYKAGKKIIEDIGLSRVHIHTLNFHTVIAKAEYSFEPENIRDSMLFSSLAAVSMAEKGSIPKSDEIKFEDSDMHLNRLDHLEDFEQFFDLENFTETGIAQIEDYKVVAVPTIIHEQPKRLVGMGDIISSGAFIAEIN